MRDSGHRGLLIVVRFVRGRRHEADRAEQAATGEPIDPVQGGKFDGFQRGPPIAPSDHLRLVQANHGFGHGIVIRVASTADGWSDAGVSQALRLPHGHVLHPAVAVVDQAPDLVAALMQRLLEGIEHQVGTHGVRDLPADNPPRHQSQAVHTTPSAVAT